MSFVCQILCWHCDEKINTCLQVPHSSPCPFLVFLCPGKLLTLLSPQMSGFLSKLFKAILPLEWGKEDCTGAAESPDCPGGLCSSSQAGLPAPGRTVCHHAVSILRPVLGCPALCCNVLRGNSPGGAEEWELMQPFRSTAHYYWPQRRGQLPRQLRTTTSTVAAGWLQWDGGLKRMTVIIYAWYLKGWCWWASTVLFFKAGARYEKIWKESYEIKFLAPFNLSLLPFLHIW